MIRRNSCENAVVLKGTPINGNDSEIDTLRTSKDVYLRKREETKKEIQVQTVIGDVNVMYQTDNVHLGTHITFNGPVTISNFTKQDWKRINEKCYCEGKENEQISKESRTLSNINEIKKEIMKNWNHKKCVYLGLAVTLIEIIILLLHFLVFRSDKKIEIIDGVNQSILSEMNSNLPKFVPRKHWGLDQECTFNCGINFKSKIKFVVVKSVWSDCFLVDENCRDSLNVEFNRTKENRIYSFNDVYFNYIVGFQGNIFEGRPLHCPFDEPLLVKKNYSSVVTIGIPICIIGSTNTYAVFSQNVYEAITVLIKQLVEFDILKKDHILELPDICKHTLLSSMLTENKLVKFYDHDNDMLYVSSHLNPDVMTNLLFLSDDHPNRSQVTVMIHRDSVNVSVTDDLVNENGTNGDSVKNKINVTNDNETTLNGSVVSDNHSDDASRSGLEVNITGRDSLDPSLPKLDYSCENNSEWFMDNQVDQVVIRIVYHYGTLQSKCGTAEECWAGDNGVYDYVKDTLDDDVLRRINYFVLLPGEAVYECASIYCSLTNLAKQKVIVTIIVIDTYSTGNSEEKITLLSKLFLPIVKEVKNRVNYSSVHFQLLCDAILVPMMLLYEMFTNDLSFLTEENKQVSNSFECRE